MIDLEKVRYSSAEVLALAVFEMFPDVELLDGSISPSGFYYDFYFPHPVHPELHTQIEEKMRQIVREKREIRQLEMAAASAIGFLKSKRLFNKAALVEGPGLFSLVQIGEFADFGYGSYLENTGDLLHFKLFPPTHIGDRQIRILGTAYTSKEDLKEFIKKWKYYSQNRHERRGEIQNLWKVFEEGIVWLEKGIEKRNKLISLFKENLIEALQTNSPRGPELHKDLIHKLSCNALFEVSTISEKIESIEDVGLIDSETKSLITLSTFLKNGNSLLQSIAKTLNILGFDFSMILTRSKRGKGALEESLKSLVWKYERLEGEKSLLEFFVADGLGRKWAAVSVTEDEYLTVQVNVERNLALLLYQTN